MTYSRDLRADAAVIGGGAAGLLAAARAAGRGLDVVLIERGERCGRKLAITGKGRCNVTNDCDIRTFMSNIPVNGKFLYSAVSRFSPADAMAHFEVLGVPLKTERGGRVFPVSDNAHDIVRALERSARRSGVRFMHARALDILTDGGAVCGVETEAGRVNCPCALVCTGGMSYPATGSDGDGYEFARRLGHNVVPPRGSLVPLTSPDGTCRDLMGLSLRNVAVTVLEDGKRIYSDFGELLFTHFGLSGPTILSASAHMRGFGRHRYCVSIDLKPALDEKTLDRRLLADFGKHKNSDFINSLGELLPRKLIPVIVRRSGIDPHGKVNSVTRAQRQRLLELLKDFTIEIDGTRPVAEAIVTTGGVDVREVDPRTMESKLVPGLYFAGEVLDTDGYTGGFNLQIAWSTAAAAADSIKTER